MTRLSLRARLDIILKQHHAGRTDICIDDAGVLGADARCVAPLPGAQQLESLCPDRLKPAAPLHQSGLGAVANLGGPGRGR